MCKLFTAEQRKQLLTHGRASHEGEHDPYPVVKLFTPDANATWFITELDPDAPRDALSTDGVSLVFA